MCNFHDLYFYWFLVAGPVRCGLVNELLGMGYGVEWVDGGCGRYMDAGPRPGLPVWGILLMVECPVLEVLIED